MRWKQALTVVECHAEGEVGKVIVGGIGPIRGETMFDKKLYFEEHYDQIRRLVLFEPRGAAVHCANVITPSNHPDADMGYIILEATECPAMSGSNTICVATVLLVASLAVACAFSMSPIPSRTSPWKPPGALLVCVATVGTAR